MSNLKVMSDKEFIQLTDKIMETEAFIEFLEEQLKKHLSEETRDKYRRQLKGAKNKLNKLNKKIYEDLKKRGEIKIEKI